MFDSDNIIIKIGVALNGSGLVRLLLAGWFRARKSAGVLPFPLC